MSDANDKKIVFLQEYVDLCKKHGFFVDGCGCCKSPYLTEGNPDVFHLLQVEDIINVDRIIIDLNDPSIMSEYDLSDEQKEEVVNKIINNP